VTLYIRHDDVDDINRCDPLQPECDIFDQDLLSLLNRFL